MVAGAIVVMDGPAGGGGGGGGPVDELPAPHPARTDASATVRRLESQSRTFTACPFSITIPRLQTGEFLYANVVHSFNERNTRPARQ